MRNLQRALRDLFQYPSAIFGTIVILILVAIGVYAIIKIPYQQAITLWRGEGQLWYRVPKTAPPTWTNLFRRVKLPESFMISSADPDSAPDGTRVEKKVTHSESGSEFEIVYTFEYPYQIVPQDVVLYFLPEYDSKPPFASVTWITPDGREIRIVDGATAKGQAFYFSQDSKLQRRLATNFPQEAVFYAPGGAEQKQVVTGTYTVRLNAYSFEPDADYNAELVMHGKVYGWAGSDHMRRDLGIALLWGIPVAMSFGLLAALGTSITTMIIAGIGTWYGGWLDELIQRITEVNLLLPLLPILIMIGTLYSRSIWVILSVTILFSIFGGGIKTYRAIFLQVRELPYIEAARAYGASDGRIIMRYLVPRIIPLLIPGLVTGIPGFVFLEASLAVLGLGDPVLPTWGKVIEDAQRNGALYLGQYYWVLEPAVLLMITGLAFAMLGFALDRVFNPRLRGI